MRVFIAHPGLQHAHHLAEALHERGWLLAFWSGVPLCERPGRGWGWFPVSVRTTTVPGRLRRHFPIWPLLRRLVSRLLPGEAGYRLNHGLDGAFDRFVALWIPLLRPDVVIAYENSALHSFRAARRIGALCVLDGAAVHPAAAAGWLPTPWPAAEAAITARKEAEIRLAHRILCCSPLAATTYQEAGVPGEKLSAIPLGTTLPVQLPQPPLTSFCVSFCFVGCPRALKGMDVLLSLFERLEAEGAPAHLSVYGSGGENSLLQRARRLSNVELKGFLPQQELMAEVARHHCLLLPSRFDSFGMVVPEAMAMGVPALVSDRVGARCILEAHPEAGWVVPFEPAAIQARIRELLAAPEQILAARPAARRAAADYSWAAYRGRVVETIGEAWRSWQGQGHG